MIYEIDPLCDARWPRLLTRHRLAGVFHSPEWLTAIRQTYGYAARALTSSPPGQELENGLVFCRVQSWLTGKRIVSVPFSDHCAPLVENADELACLVDGLKRECDAGAEKYIEVRPPADQIGLADFAESAKFHLHHIDLRPGLDELFNRFHLSCVRRRISRAVRADVVYEEGRTEILLKFFYQMALLTRRRQKLPPQPLRWFRNLITCLGERLKFRLAFYAGRPIAGILTLRYRETMTYKYGFSDPSFHRLGSMQLLLWKAIQDAKAEGLTEFDLGRSDWTDEGLTKFKNRWGAICSTMSYLRYPGIFTTDKHPTLGTRIVRQLFAFAPDKILATAGDVLYRHIA